MKSLCVDRNDSLRGVPLTFTRLTYFDCPYRGRYDTVYRYFIPINGPWYVYNFTAEYLPRIIRMSFVPFKR